tara:strand:- start:65 stop:556 length:492 start_codon:yes stop_codon:yes gene_type:complete
MKVQDNFLRNDLFKFILNTINDTNFCWQCNKIVSEEKFQSDLKYNKQFVHKIYPSLGLYNEYYEIFQLVLLDLNIKELLRMKLNFIPRTEKIIRHGFHIDTEEYSKTSILYFNTNDGYTEFEKTGEKVQSVANRIVTFDSSEKHLGTTCTNDYARLVLNINWK